MATRVTNNTFTLPSLLKEGTKHLQGPEEAIYRNIAACNQVVKMTASSYGPLGLSKLIINQHGKLVFTSDAGVILKEVGVEHPAARIILMAAEQQKMEHGDASGWVCVMVSEWLSKAEELLRMGMSASQVVDGFETAALKAEEILGELAYVGGDEDQVIRTALMSKQYGQEGFLTDLVEKAIQIIQKDDKSIINPDNIRVVKVLGGSLTHSTVLKGMLFNKEVEGRVRSVIDASSPFIKVAIYACPLGAGRTETKGTVLFNNAQEMLAFNKGEEAQVHAQIRAIAETGVRVVISGDTISEVAAHFLDANNILALKIPSKFDLKRLARALGASPLARMGAPMEEEMGRAESVETVEVGADRCVLFKASENAGDLATILLRGSNTNQLDDIERAMEDAIASIKAFRRDKRLLPGAGATEAELSRRLQAFATSCPGVSQYAIKKFGEALDAIPRILATNAGLNDAEIISKLQAAPIGHGINIESADTLVNSAEEGIVDIYSVKLAALRHAVEAALTILRIDQIIMSKPAPGPAPRAPGPMDAD